MGFFAKYVRKWPFSLANKLMSAYHFKHLQNIQFKNHGIAPTPPPPPPNFENLPYPVVGGSFWNVFAKMKGKDELEGTRSNFTI